MKLKSKKMSKSTFAVILMAIAMIAMLAFGGTYAYFTSAAVEATAETKVTTATIELTAGTGSATIEITEEDAAYLLPGDEIAISANVGNGSNEKIYAFVKFAVDTEEDLGITITPSGDWTPVPDVDDVYYAEIEIDGEISLEGTGTFPTTAGNTLQNQEVGVKAVFAAAQFRNLDVAAAYAQVEDILVFTAAN